MSIYELYSESTSVKPICNLIFLCNTLPKISVFDEETRWPIFEIPTKFPAEEKSASEIDINSSKQVL